MRRRSAGARQDAGLDPFLAYLAAVADAFTASRLDGDWGGAFGTLPPGVDTGPIVKRVTLAGPS